MDSQKLTPDFLNELFKGCIRSEVIRDTCIKHLKYHFLPDDTYKRLFRSMIAQVNQNNRLTIGLLSDVNKINDDVIDLINDIKNASIQTDTVLLNQLESYIRTSMLLELHTDLKNDFNSGQHDKAFTVLSSKSKEISDFSLKNKQFSSVFSGFRERYNIRVKENNSEEGRKRLEKAPVGIDSIDRRIYGGVNRGDTLMWIARGGTGKTTSLRHSAVYNARLGGNVLHIQGEGSKKECLDGYDAYIAATSISKTEFADIPEDKVERITKKLNTIQNDIHVVAFEQFDTATLEDVRNIVIDYIKLYGVLDLLVIDYFDVFNPAGGRKYSASIEGEKARRQDLGRQLKNLAMEQNIPIFTGTQASNVSKAILNKPDFVLTRDNIKGDKNQIDPFSYVFSLNQTDDEYVANVMRIHEEKIRKIKGGNIHKIITNYSRGRFYDRNKTIEMFG